LTQGVEYGSEERAEQEATMNCEPTTDLEPSEQPTALASQLEPEQRPVEDLLIEEISIDGMCGVY